mgnify:CR=1 FL=1
MKNNKGKAFLIIGSLTFFGVGGVSILGGVSFFDSLIKEFKLVLSDAEKDDHYQSITQTPVPTEHTEPIAQPTIEPNTLKDTPSTSPTIIYIEKSNPVNIDELIDQLETLNLEKGETEINKPKECEADSDNFSEKNNSNEDIDIVNNNNGSEMKKSTYEISVDSPGQILMLASDSNNENENINISYKQDQETVSGQSIAAVDSNDLINENNISNSQQLNYLNVIPGIYIFETTYNFDNVNLYFVNDINGLSCGVEESYERIVVPMNENIKVEISKDNQIKNFKAIFNHGFKPLIKFYSDDTQEKNLLLKILDENKLELQHVELNYVNSEGSHEFISDFSFEAGKEYYIQISTVDNIEISQTCYFLISQAVEEDLIETYFE